MNGPDVFDVVYADPPWRYDNGTPGREIERHYPTMSHDDICGLDVPAAKDAVLFLWGVAPKLPEALAVMCAWGFTYRSSAVWDKQIPGMGYWFRGQHEHLLVGVRGRWSPPLPSMRVASVHSEPRQRHSTKPARIRALIAAWWPDARRLEMFCRHPAPGWHSWGNQVDSSVANLPADRYDPSEHRGVPGQGDLYAEDVSA